MKKKLYIKTALSLMSVVLLSSCLKESKYAVNFNGAPLVELPGAANVSGTAGPFESVALAITATPTVFNVPVNLAATKPLGSPVTVKLSVDQAALTAYNHSMGLDTGGNTPYVLLPAADYSSSLSVTIPAGKNLVNLVVNINTSLIDPSQAYVLPLTITDGGGQQISNYKTILYNIQVKNKYDGVYMVTGSLVDKTVPTITGNYPNTVSLVTEGATTVAYADSTGANLSFAHIISSGGMLSSYGVFTPVFQFDPTTNKITAVTNLYGQPEPDSRARAARIDPSGINAFTSGTPGTAGAVFKVKYVLVQAGADRTFFTETYTYVGPR